jgi:hypothetical protein
MSFMRLGYQIPFKVARCTQKNWIRDQTHTYGSGQVVISNSDITRVIENTNNLITKEKVGKFKLQRQKNQVSTSLKTE